MNNTKTYELYINPVYRVGGTAGPADELDDVFGYDGIIDGINIDTNIEELKDCPMMFAGSTKEQVIEDVIKYLKGEGLSGKLRLVNQ